MPRLAQLYFTWLQLWRYVRVLLESTLGAESVHYFPDGHGVSAVPSRDIRRVLTDIIYRNKWVLNSTDVPLFFLCTQLAIAVVLFLVAHALGVIQVPLQFDPEVLKGLVPMVGLNVIGLRYVHCSYKALMTRCSLLYSFSNYTLKYVDASFYQVARGMVLPFTVVTSYIFLHSRPSAMVILACSVVTFGFFVGVFLDGTSVSVTGISFGVASSMITAMHSVVIKKALDVVKGSALHLSWYTNLLSAIILFPILLLAGEGPGVQKLLFAPHVVPVGGVSPLATFLWGSAITVRDCFPSLEL